MEEPIIKIKSEYEWQNFGKSSFYLKIKIEKTAEGYKLNERNKTEELVKKYKLKMPKHLAYLWKPDIYVEITKIIIPK